MGEQEGDEVFGGDTCAHCGATALESFDCALNGCRFGLLAEQSDGPASADAAKDKE